jgi:phosphinothricin acetyltransferase
MCGLAFDHLFRDRAHSSVVDGVLDSIRPRGACQVSFELDVYREALRTGALGIGDAVLAAEHHALEDDPVHVRNCGDPVRAKTDGRHRLARVETESATPAFPPADVLVRPAAEDDLGSLNDVYNEYVVQSHATFDVEPTSLEWRQEWFRQHGLSGRHRVMVAVVDGRVIGYASSGRFRPKKAYETSIEVSVYVTGDAIGQGVGTRLYRNLFAALAGEDVHRAYAGIALPNPASVALHERFGFKKVAHFTEQGRKFGRYWDVAWYEKALSPA